MSAEPSVVLVAISRDEDGLLHVSDCKGEHRGTAETSDELREIVGEILEDPSLPSTETPDPSLVAYEDVIRRSAEILKNAVDKRVPAAKSMASNLFNAIQSPKIKGLFERDAKVRAYYPRGT